tara:strand:- start:2607 stop:4160 length:1554 start_codon:yes stop_codon:yes gene_type:complete
MKKSTVFDSAFDMLKSKRAKAIAAAQPGQQVLIQDSPQATLAGENAGLTEVSDYLRRVEADEKERERRRKMQEKYEAERAAMMKPGQQTLSIPQPDQDIQQVVNENEEERQQNMGFRRAESTIEEMEMLGMIQKAPIFHPDDRDEKDEKKRLHDYMEKKRAAKKYAQKQKQLGDSFGSAMTNENHPLRSAVTSYDMHGNPIQGDRDLEDSGGPCSHCGEGLRIYTDEGAVGCSTEDCVANHPDMLQVGDDMGSPHYKRQQFDRVKVGEVTPTRTYQQDKKKPPGGSGFMGLFPMAPDPDFEPHIKIDAMRPQQVTQLVDAQGNPPKTMQDMRHPDIRTGEPMDIAMRLLKHAESPEAKKHKKEYDTKYESTPERRKYRTELTQERRKRGVAGKGGKDMSHTARGTIVPEDMHANRARHFKERGTLKKNLNRWFKEKWVDVSRKNKDGKHPPCGRSKAKKSSKGYPKCRPSVKVSNKTPKTSGSMSEGQKRAATKRKRSRKQGVGGKPTIVKMVSIYE